MIHALTHDAQGKPIQSLEIGLRVAIGLPADEAAGRRAPTKLDHFIFQTKTMKGEWIENKQVTDKIREASGLKKDDPIRKIRIFFTTDDIEEAFRTNLEWWSRSELKCRGNGLVASRSLNIVSDELKNKYAGQRYIPWTPCGETCPDYIRKKDGCKPSGDLTFVLQDLPKLGSMCGFFTTSKKSIAQIFSSLHQIAGPDGLTRGHLKLIPFEMVLKGGKTRYQDSSGAAKTGNAFFVNLEMRDTDQDNLLATLREHATKFDRMMAEIDRPASIGTGVGSTRLLPAVNRMPEAEKAVIMASEFNGGDDPEDPETLPPGEHEEEEKGKDEVEKVTTAAVDEVDQSEAKFNELCKEIDLSPGRRDAVLQKLGGDLAEAKKFMERFIDSCKQLEYDKEKSMEMLGKGVGSGFDEMFAFFDREIKKKAKKEKRETKAEPAAAAPAVTETKPAEPETKAAAVVPDEMKGW